ncbi:MAG: enoyl-CoA hydratase-related protein [Planctomycetota bacterium]|jgi:enoyl-CoA hydratase|nr:enoyl-CoA hydratase-related protein [Planctomycetota bacterium]MDP6837367.1 enoyl-CoA hydratase-related protein [Planctomycetota bacterium]
MAFENILVEVEGGVGRVTVNRPKVLNALNAQTIGELECAFTQLGEDDAVRVVLVTGAGDKAFVAGADINELAELQPLEAKAVAARGQAAFRVLEDLGKPSVAMINGFALGGGCELALACTLRMASSTARLGLPEVSLGLLPGYGGTQRLARVAGLGVAREWVLTGDMFSAEEAQRVGVVNRVFAPEELEAGTGKLVKTLLSRGPLALSFAMTAIGRGINMSQVDGEALETDMFGLAATTDDMREGLAAFIEKRSADFKGR